MELLIHVTSKEAQLNSHRIVDLGWFDYIPQNDMMHDYKSMLCD